MPKVRKLTGKKAHNPIAVKIVGQDKHTNNMWLCKCDCGGEKIIRANSFGNVKSCGCISYHGRDVDISGKIYGRLAAARPGKLTETGSRYWFFKCKCGIEKEILKSSVVNRRVNSCGCIVIERGKKRWGPGSSHWKGGKTISSGGYVLIYNPKHPNADKSKGYVLEHVMVMAQKLGRSLKTKEIVHHKNGIKTDNRIENLELWMNSHPKGQRIEDMISFAIFILNEYAPEKLTTPSKRNNWDNYWKGVPPWDQKPI